MASKAAPRVPRLPAVLSKPGAAVGSSAPVRTGDGGGVAEPLPVSLSARSDSAVDMRSRASPMRAGRLRRRNNSRRSRRSSPRTRRRGRRASDTDKPRERPLPHTAGHGLAPSSASGVGSIPETRPHTADESKVRRFRRVRATSPVSRQATSAWMQNPSDKLGPQRRTKKLASARLHTPSSSPPSSRSGSPELAQLAVPQTVRSEGRAQSRTRRRRQRRPRSGSALDRSQSNSVSPQRRVSVQSDMLPSSRASSRSPSPGAGLNGFGAPLAPAFTWAPPSIATGGDDHGSRGASARSWSRLSMMSRIGSTRSFVSSDTVETTASKRIKRALRPENSAAYKAKLLGVEVIETAKDNRRGSVSTVASKRPATSPVPSMLAREERKRSARSSARSRRPKTRPASTPSAGVRTGVSAIKALGKRRPAIRVELRIPDLLLYDDYAKTRTTKQLKLGHWNPSDALVKSLDSSHRRLRRLDLENCTDLSDEAVMSLIRVTTCLTHCNLRNISTVSDETALQLISKNKDLKSLNVEGCTALTDSVVRAVAQFSRCLMHLNLQGCINVTDRALLALSKKSLSLPLATLNLSQCEKISDGGLMAMMDGIRRVHELKIADLPKVTDMGFMGMKAPRLMSLDVSGLQLTDIGLAWIGEGAPRLERIQLHGCENMSVLGLTSIAERCTSLKKLDMGANRGLNSEWLKALAVGFGRGGKSLTWLKMENSRAVDDRAVMAIARVSPNLSFLSMIGLSRVSDHGFSFLAEHCTSLTSVILKKRFSYAGGGVRATNDTLAAFARHCPHLRVFHCAGMLRVSDFGVTTFVKGCKELRVLNFSACENLTDKAWFAIAKYAGNVTNLDMSSSEGVTTKGVFAVCKSLTSLKSLNLSSTPCVDDQCITLLARCNSSLTRLSVSKCAKVTDASVKSLACLCKGLLSLDVSHCFRITDKALGELSQHCMRLQHLQLHMCQEVTATALQSLEAVLPLAQLSGVYFGLRAVSSSKGIALRMQYMDMAASLVWSVRKIQALWRRLWAKRVVATIRAERRRQRLILEYKSAVTIKRYMRGHVARVKYHTLQRKRAAGAFVITRFFQHLVPRMRLFKSRPARLRRNRGITLFQAVQRGYMARSWFKRQQRAALLVSRTFKGLVARKRIRGWRAAALSIQRVLRGHFGRQKARMRKRACLALAMEVQRLWRGYRERRWYHRVRDQRHSAATRIQKGWKRVRLRRLLLGQWLDLVRMERARVIQAELDRKRREEEHRIAVKTGATGLQKVFRGWKGRKRFTFLRRLYDWTYRREQAVVKMQRWWRTICDNTELQRQERLKMLAEQARQMDDEMRQQQEAEDARYKRQLAGVRSFSGAVMVGFLLPRKTNRQRLAEAKVRRRQFMEHGAARIIQTFWRAVLWEREVEWWRMRMIAKVQAVVRGWKAQRVVEQLRMEKNEAAYIIQTNWRIVRQRRLQLGLIRAKVAAVRQRVEQEKAEELRIARLRAEDGYLVEEKEQLKKIQRVWRRYHLVRSRKEELDGDLVAERKKVDERTDELRKKQAAAANFEQALKLSTRMLRSIGVKKKGGPVASAYTKAPTYGEIHKQLKALAAKEASEREANDKAKRQAAKSAREAKLMQQYERGELDADDEQKGEMPSDESKGDDGGPHTAAISLTNTPAMPSLHSSRGSSRQSSRQASPSGTPRDAKGKKKKKKKRKKHKSQLEELLQVADKGLTHIAFTVGDVEREGMELDQVERRGLNQPFYERVDYDLSMPMARPSDAMYGAQEYTQRVVVQMRERKRTMLAKQAEAVRLGEEAQALTRDDLEREEFPRMKVSNVPSKVYMWTMRERHPKLITSVRFVRKRKSKRESVADRMQRYKAEGFEVVTHADLKFELLVRKDGKNPLADIVPGAWASRSAEAIDLEADGYTKLDPELGRLGLAQGLGMWVLPTHRDVVTKQGNRVHNRPEPWYNDHVYQVQEMVQLKESSLKAIHKAFEALDTDGDGLVSDTDMLGAIKLEPNKFTMFLKKFLVPGKHSSDMLDFGEWLHFVTRVALLGNDQMVRVMFRWADADNFHAVTDSQIMELFMHVRQAAPGLVHRKQIMSALPRLQRDSTGRIPLHEFVKLCGHWPYLYFPLARLQDRLQHQVMGKKFWKKVKQVLAGERARSRESSRPSSRDSSRSGSRRSSLDFRSLRRSIVAPLQRLGLIAGESEEDKIMSRALEIEKCTRRPELVAQVYAHYVSAYDSFVAIVVANLEKCYRYATSKGITITSHKALCTNQFMVDAVSQSINLEQKHAGHGPELLLKAIHLVPYKFTKLNYQMTEHGYLHRKRIQQDYKRQLNEMGQALYARVARPSTSDSTSSRGSRGKRRSLVGVLERKARLHRSRRGKGSRRVSQ